MIQVKFTRLEKSKPCSRPGCGKEITAQFTCGYGDCEEKFCSECAIFPAIRDIKNKVQCPKCKRTQDLPEHHKVKA